METNNLKLAIDSLELTAKKKVITFFRGEYSKGNVLLQIEWDKNPFEGREIDSQFLNIVTRKLQKQRNGYYSGLKYFLNEVNPKYLEAYENRLKKVAGPFTVEQMEYLNDLDKVINRFPFNNWKLKSGNIHIKIDDKFVYLKNDITISEFAKVKFDKDNIGLFKSSLKTVFDQQIWLSSAEEVQDKIKTK